MVSSWILLLNIALTTLIKIMSVQEGSQSGSHLAETLYTFSQRKSTQILNLEQDTTLFCHKNMLCAQSSYFDSLCLSGLNEVTIDKFVSSDFNDQHILNIVVRFLYLETVNLTKDSVEEVLQVADFIKCEKLKSACEHFMISELDLQNCRKYTEIAQEVNLLELEKARANLLLHIANEWFLQELTSDELLPCLQANNLEVKTEDEISDALRKWLTNSHCGHMSNAKKEEYVDLNCFHLFNWHHANSRLCKM